MNGSTALGRLATAWLAGAMLAGAACAADPMVTTDDLLRDPKFKAAYLAALGPKGKEKWLATMTNSSLVRKVSVGGFECDIAAVAADRWVEALVAERKKSTIARREQHDLLVGIELREPFGGKLETLDRQIHGKHSADVRCQVFRKVAETATQIQHP